MPAHAVQRLIIIRTTRELSLQSIIIHMVYLMGFNWTTFILEIINFLILIWILKRLLYKPIKKIILARKEEIQKTLDEANHTKQEAEDLQKKYAASSKEWEKEKEEKLTQLQSEMQAEKKRQEALLVAALKTEKEKSQAQEEQRIANLIVKKEKEVIINTVKFSAKFLKQFADATLENKILDLFVNTFSELPQEKIVALKNEIDHHNTVVQVKSAFPLNDEQKNKIKLIFEKTFANNNLTYNFVIDTELLAGLLVSIGSTVFDANLKNELQLFAEVQMVDKI